MSPASVVQLVGGVLLSVGGCLLWSPWVLVLVGLLMLVVPELTATVIADGAEQP